MKRFDVAIVGAGPAGSSAATSIAQRGYSVILVDKRCFPAEKLCGDFLNPVSWPVLQRLGVADELLSLPHGKIRGFRISSMTSDEAVFPLSTERDDAFGLGMRRFYLDDLLAKGAKKAGAVLRQGYRIKDLQREADGWAITLNNQFNDEKIRSDFLIGADGRNSWVAERLGTARRSGKRSGFVGFQVNLKTAQRMVPDVQIHLFPGGYAGLVDVGAGLLNLCLSIAQDQARGFLSIEALLENQLYRNRYLRRMLEGSQVAGELRSAYPIYFSPRRSYGERFLLVGDAARVTEPVTGEGIYFALKSAELAAEAIHGAFMTRDFSDRRLSAYQETCRRSFSSRLRMNGLVRSLIHHPALLAPLIRLSGKTSFPIRPVLRFVCSAN